MGGIARNAGERAAKAVGKYKGYDDLSVGGLGSLTYDKSVPSLELDPQQQALQTLFGQIGMGTGEAAASLTPGVQQVGQSLLSGSQGLMADIAGFDPLGAAEERFNRLQGVLQERRDINRSAEEAKLLRQGRLDSTSGARQLAESDRAIAQEDAMLLDRMFGEAEAAQRGARQDALALGQAGAQVQGGLINELIGAQGGVTAGGQNLLQLLNASNALRQTEINRLIGASQALSGHNQVAADGGGGGLGGALGTVAGGVIGGIYGGPAGATAGAQIGGAAGGMFSF